MAEEVVEQFSISKVSVLDENGNVNGDIGNLSPDDLRTMYWYMNLSRLLDDKMLNMQKQGKLGTFASIRGQEGGQVAIAQAVKGISNIWYAPTFRENALMTALEIPMDKILQYWGGFEEGSQIDPKFNMLPVSIPIGSQLNHAVGIARAMQIKGEQGAVFGFLGDGATSEGETHEAMNYAGMWNSPVIFFCQNNHFAISVRREHQTAAKTLAQKAIAYGYEGVQVDGNDALAVYQVVKKALEKALNGGGPTFIESMTYRIGNHTTADDWHRYRTQEEVDEWVAKDPIARFRKYMHDAQHWDDQNEEHMLLDAKKRVDEAVEKYLQTPEPGVDQIFDSTFAILPPLHAKQKEALKKFWGAEQ